MKNFYVSYIKRQWSKDFDTLVGILNQKNNYIEKTDNSIIVKIYQDDVDFYLKVFSESVKENAWHDIIGEHDSYIIFNDKTVHVKNSLHQADETWLRMRSYEKSLEVFETFEEMVLNSKTGKYIQSQKYDSWNQKKKEISAKKSTDKFIKEREIWWISLGLNIGHEQDGKNEQFERPFLVVKKFNKSIVWGLPLTTVAKDNKFHYKIQEDGSYVILSQLRLISTKRFLRRIKVINENLFEDIVDKTIQLFPKKRKPGIHQAFSGD
jgi:mRNA interferase MazF